MKLKDEIEGSVEKCGLRRLIEDARDRAKTHSREIFRQRTQSANIRRAEDDPEGYEDWIHTRLAQLEAGRRNVNTAFST